MQTAHARMYFDMDIDSKLGKTGMVLLLDSFNNYTQDGLANEVG